MSKKLKYKRRDELVIENERLKKENIELKQELDMISLRVGDTISYIKDIQEKDGVRQ